MKCKLHTWSRIATMWNCHARCRKLRTICENATSHQKLQQTLQMRTSLHATSWCITSTMLRCRKLRTQRILIRSFSPRNHVSDNVRALPHFSMSFLSATKSISSCLQINFKLDRSTSQARCPGHHCWRTLFRFRYHSPPGTNCPPSPRPIVMINHHAPVPGAHPKCMARRTWEK